MRHVLTALAISVIAIVATGCEQSAAPLTPLDIALAEYLPKGTAFTDLQVSANRERAIVTGYHHLQRDGSYTSFCLVLDLKKRAVADLNSLLPQHQTFVYGQSIALSPDGQCLALVMGWRDEKSQIDLVDLSGKGQRPAQSLVFDWHGACDVRWAGPRLLLYASGETPVLSYDPKTKKQERLPLFASEIQADSSGKRLLARAGNDVTTKPSFGWGDFAVVTPQGQLLRRIPGSGCLPPMLSSNGKYAALFHIPDDGAASIRVVSIDDGKTKDIDNPSQLLCVMDNGEPVIYSENGPAIWRQGWKPIVPAIDAQFGRAVGHELFYVDGENRRFRSILVK